MEKTMTNQDTYNLSNELTETEANNIVRGWEIDADSDSLDTYNALVKLGDSKEMAVATTIAEKYNRNDYSNSLYEKQVSN